MKKRLLLCGIMAFAMAFASGAAAPKTVQAQSRNIKNDTFWHDIDGNPIYSQGGGIFKFKNPDTGKDTYYWYGVKYKEAEAFYKNPAKGYSTTTFEAVTCYTSDDLTNWKFEGNVLTESEVSGVEQTNGNPATWLGRMGVAYMEESGTYVMAIQHEFADPGDVIDNAGGDTSKDGVTKQVLLLRSDSPTGQFKWDQRINMASYTGGTSNTGDQTVFTDEDTGKDYLLYSYGRGRNRIFLSEIRENAEGKIEIGEPYKVFQGDGREGNCMFKYNGKYYICASDLYGWNASHAYYMVLDSLEPEYLEQKGTETKMQVMPGCSDDFCHVSQTGFFYTVQGSAQDTVLFCGDRWSDFANNGLGYNQWCPLSFDGDVPYFNSLSSWNLDMTTGEWSAAEDNNHIKNGSFDADRVSASSLAGWKNTVEKGSSPIKNSGNAVTGKYGLALTDTVDFAGSISQEVKTTPYVELPDGEYDMTAYIKGSGDFKVLQMYAVSGSMTFACDITENGNDWKKVTLENIPVSGGAVEVGFLADGKAKTACYIDDITFIKTDTTAERGAVSGTIHSDDVGKNVFIHAVREDGTDVYTCQVPIAEEDQSFSINMLRPGTYLISASCDGYALQEEPQRVTVLPNETVEGIQFTLVINTGDVSGKVTDESGSVLSDVKVILKNDDSEFIETTDGEGKYSFSTIQAGIYELYFEKMGYTNQGPVWVEVKKGEIVHAVDTVMERNAGTLTGTVTDMNGNPAGKAKISLRGCNAKDDMTRYQIETEADGTFCLENVMGGVYQVIASTDSAVSAVRQNVQVTKGAEVSVDMVIPQETEIVNGDFEQALSVGWVNEYTYSPYGCYITSRAKEIYEGKGSLSYYRSSPYLGHTYQTLYDIPNGTYTVNVMVNAGVKDTDDFYMYAKNGADEIIAKENIPTNTAYEMIGLEAEVTDNTLKIGFYGNMGADTWCRMDNIRVGYVAAEEPDKPVEKEGLNNLLEEVESLKPEDYTQSSYTALMQVKETAEGVAENPEAAQEEVEEAVKALNNAKDALVSVKVLRAAVEQKAELAPDGYTTESWEDFADALDHAQSVLNNPDVSQNDVDEAYKDLILKWGCLVPGVNTVVAEAVAQEAASILENDTSIYRPEGIENLKNALRFLNSVLEDKNAAQEDVNDAAEKLIYALMELKDMVSAERLESIVDLAKFILEDQKKYTSDSVKALQDIITDAEGVIANEDRSQQDVSAHYEAVAEAICGLKLRGDKSALESVWNMADEILKSSEKYTASSLEGLQEAVDAVRPVYEDVDATGEEVNEAARLLTGQLVEVRILGDVNNDKNVDTSDTALVLKLSAELLTIEDMDREAADVNRDGDVDTADAVLIQKFAAELIGSF